MEETQQQTDILQAIYETQGLLSECTKDTRNIAAAIARGNGGREVALAITKLQEAQMWLRQAVTEIDKRPLTEGQHKGG